MYEYLLHFFKLLLSNFSRTLGWLRDTGHVQRYMDAMIRPVTMIKEKSIGINNLKIEFFVSSFMFWGGGMTLAAVVSLFEMANEARKAF